MMPAATAVNDYRKLLSKFFFVDEGLAHAAVFMFTW
jgi:hypothetical protein